VTVNPNLLTHRISDAPSHRSSGKARVDDIRLPILLVGYLAFLLALTWLGFFLGIAITRYHLAILSLAFVSLVFVTGRQWRAQLPWMALSVLASLLISLVFIDRSWDSLWYHKRAVIALADGWNPAYQILSIKDLPWPDVYWKTTWILGALAYKTIPLINVVAFVNWVLMAAAFVSARAALGVVELPPRWINLIAGLIALSPVCSLQLTTSCVDGFVASCVSIVTCALLGYCAFRRTGFLVLACCGSALALTVKVSCVTYLASFALAAAVFLSINSGVSGLKPVLGTAVAAGVLSIWLGFNPYVTNYIRYGNPLYPLVGVQKIDNIISNATPKTYADRSRLESLAISVFSRSTADDLPNEHPGLKYPGSLFLDELKGMYSPSMKFGGFGPLFSASFLLAVVGLATIPRRDAVFAVCAGLAVIGVSLINPAAWWARYVPWLWLLPLGALVLIVVRGRGPFSQWLCLALAGVSLANVVICLAVSLGAALVFTAQTWETILEVRRWPNLVEIERTHIPAFTGGVQELHQVPKRLLSDLGLEVDEVDSCAGAQRTLPFFKSNLCGD
jgi:hypothetical protein